MRMIRSEHGRSKLVTHSEIRDNLGQTTQMAAKTGLQSLLEILPILEHLSVKTEEWMCWPFMYFMHDFCPKTEMCFIILQIAILKVVCLLFGRREICFCKCDTNSLFVLQGIQCFQEKLTIRQTIMLTFKL